MSRTFWNITVGRCATRTAVAAAALGAALAAQAQAPAAPPTAIPRPAADATIASAGHCSAIANSGIVARPAARIRQIGRP